MTRVCVWTTTVLEIPHHVKETVKALLRGKIKCAFPVTRFLFRERWPCESSLSLLSAAWLSQSFGLICQSPRSNSAGGSCLLCVCNVLLAEEEEVAATPPKNYSEFFCFNLFNYYNFCAREIIYNNVELLLFILLVNKKKKVFYGGWGSARPRIHTLCSGVDGGRIHSTLRSLTIFVLTTAPSWWLLSSSRRVSLFWSIFYYLFFFFIYEWFQRIV